MVAMCVSISARVYDVEHMSKRLRGECFRFDSVMFIVGGDCLNQVVLEHIMEVRGYNMHLTVRDDEAKVDIVLLICWCNIVVGFHLAPLS